MMERVATILIYIHAIFGGISLVSGLIAIASKKGRIAHRKGGLTFYYAMLVTGLSAMTIALMPKHENPFLLAVGIFSLYFVMSGYRALKFKSEKPNLKPYIWISRVMISTAILMIILPVILNGGFNIVLTIFAITGGTFAIRDLKLYKNTEILQKSWLKLHLGKMLGGYISATTAFIVVNAFIPGIYGWILPGIAGGFYITYWVKKVSRQPRYISKLMGF